MKILRIIGLALLLNISLSAETSAQCPMCRMTVESNLKAGGTAGKGLNRGILYMLAMPYLLVGTFGYLWWKNRKSEEEFEVAGGESMN
jgi:hypothetical protein